MPRIPLVSESYARGTSYQDQGTTDALGHTTVETLPNTNLGLSLAPFGGRESTVGGSVLRVVGGFWGNEWSIGTSPRNVTATLPELETRTFHVVTDEGQPVAGAQVSFVGIESKAVDPNAYGQGRVQIGGDFIDMTMRTDADGKAQLTTYAVEPDPKVAEQFADSSWWGDRTGDGQIDLLTLNYNPKPTQQLSQWITYSEWSASTDVTLGLPYVPTLAGTTAEPGDLVGQAEVRTTLVQPTASGDSAPLAAQKLQGWAQPTGTSPRALLGTATTNAAGRAVMDVRVAKPTRVVVGLANSSHVAEVTTARPKAGVGFGRIQYDAPGADTATRASLNGEWFTVTNKSTTARQLAGWTVRDTSGDTYHFNSRVLPPGASIRVHTGRGTNTATDLYWGRSAHLWGNRSDTATLRSATGVRMDMRRWTTTGTGHMS